MNNAGSNETSEPLEQSNPLFQLSKGPAQPTPVAPESTAGKQPIAELNGLNESFHSVEKARRAMALLFQKYDMDGASIPSEVIADLPVCFFFHHVHSV